MIGSSVPGILESEVKAEVLLLKAMSFNAVGRFDFVTTPYPEVYLDAL